MAMTLDGNGILALQHMAEAAQPRLQLFAVMDAFLVQALGAGDHREVGLGVARVDLQRFQRAQALLDLFG